MKWCIVIFSVVFTSVAPMAAQSSHPASKQIAPIDLVKKAAVRAVSFHRETFTV